MAKRSRGPSRPGQQRPTRRTQRPANRPPAPAGTAVSTQSGTALTPAEEARAAELEAQLLAEESATAGGRSRRDKGRSDASLSRTRSTEASSLLAARAVEEYAYVKRDVRRIMIVGGSMFAVMFVLFILIDVTHVIVL